MKTAYTPLLEPIIGSCDMTPFCTGYGRVIMGADEPQFTCYLAQNQSARIQMEVKQLQDIVPVLYTVMKMRGAEDDDVLWADEDHDIHHDGSLIYCTPTGVKILRAMIEAERREILVSRDLVIAQAELMDEAEREAEIEAEFHSKFDEVFAQKAREKYAITSNDNIEIDDKPAISYGEGGAFVASWLFVSDDDVGIEEN